LLAKQKVFGPTVRTPEGMKPNGYIWIFAQKQIKNDEKFLDIEYNWLLKVFHKT